MKRLWSKIKSLPKRQQIMLGSFSVLIIIAIGLLIWSIVTGRIKPRAQTVCPPGSVCNTALVSYDGLVQPIESNTVITAIGSTSSVVNVSVKLQGKNNVATSGTSLKVFSVGGTTPVFENDNVTTDNSGNAQVTITGLAAGNYDFKLKSPNYLTVLKGNLSLVDQMPIDFGTLKAGDFDNNDIINGLDFSLMNGKWFGTDALLDLNSDGIINGLDFAIMNSNWFVTGQ